MCDRVLDPLLLEADRNKIESEPDKANLDYGQRGKYTGFYIGVLATECHLFKESGQYTDTDKTGYEIYLALRTFIEQMGKCETFFDQPQNSYDGFFSGDL